MSLFHVFTTNAVNFSSSKELMMSSLFNAYKKDKNLFIHRFNNTWVANNNVEITYN